MTAPRLSPAHPSIAASLAAWLLANFAAAFVLTLVQYSLFLTMLQVYPRSPQLVMLKFVILLVAGMVPSLLLLLVPRRVLSAPKAIALGLGLAYYAILALGIYANLKTGTAFASILGAQLIATLLPILAGWFIAKRFLDQHDVPASRTFVALLLTNVAAALLLQSLAYCIAVISQAADERIWGAFEITFTFAFLLLTGLLPSSLFLLMPRRWLSVPNAIGAGTFFGFCAGFLVVIYFFNRANPGQLSNPLVAGIICILGLLFAAGPVAAGWWLGRRFLAARG